MKLFNIEHLTLIALLATSCLAGDEEAKTSEDESPQSKYKKGNVMIWYCGDLGDTGNRKFHMGTIVEVVGGKLYDIKYDRKPGSRRPGTKVFRIAEDWIRSFKEFNEPTCCEPGEKPSVTPLLRVKQEAAKLTEAAKEAAKVKRWIKEFTKAQGTEIYDEDLIELQKKHYWDSVYSDWKHQYWFGFYECDFFKDGKPAELGATVLMCPATVHGTYPFSWDKVDPTGTLVGKFDYKGDTLYAVRAWANPKDEGKYGYREGTRIYITGAFTNHVPKKDTTNYGKADCNDREGYNRR